MKSAAAVLSILLIGACSMHRPVAVPTLETPERFIEDTGVKTEYVPGRWWERFNDPVLNGLMERLFTDNLDLEQGFARLEQAEAGARIAGSTRLPTLTATAEGSRGMQPSFAGDYTGNTTQFSLAAAFELDLWGKLRHRRRSAELTAQAARDELNTLYLSLSASLADLYYLAVEQRAQLALIDRTIASFEDTEALVRRRYRQGLVSAADLYQARNALAAARAARPLFEQTLARAEHGLAVLVGGYPDRHSAGNLADLPVIAQEFPAGLPADLLNRRPDVRASRARLRAADEEVAAAIADRLPSLNLFAGLGRLRQDFATGLIEGGFWNLAGDVALPVIDGGRRAAATEQSRAVVRERLAAYRQTMLNAFREVEDALATTRTMETRIERLETALRTAETSLELSLHRYRRGLNDYLPVLTAQRAALQTRMDLLAAQRGLISSRISLARALSGDWADKERDRRTTSAQGAR